MSVTSLVPNFTEVATNLGGTIAGEAGSLAFAAVSGAVAAMVATWRAKRAMNKNDYSDDMTYIKAIFFEQTDQRNPETGNYIHIFKLRPRKQIDLEKVFGESIRLEVAKRIIKASKQCTAEKPVVFEFLKDVYNYPTLLQRIINVSSWLTKKFDQSHKVDLLINNVDEHWTDFFGSTATPDKVMLYNVPKHCAPDEQNYYPILVHENDSKKRFHIFWLNQEQMNPDYYPDPRDVVLEKASEASYLPLIRAMVDQMAQAENQFIQDICRVPIPREDVKYRGYLLEAKPDCA